MRSLLVLALLTSAACVPERPVEAQALPACEWCGADEAPADLSASALIAPAGEPGQRLRLAGTVTHADGSLASGVLLYAYHTNAEGVYPRRGDETGNARRHGSLRAWVRTDDAGRYAFDTIRPGPYPGRPDPAHIHLTVTEPGRAEYWIDDVMFEGDPLLTEAYRARLDNRGGSGIVTLARDADGTWVAVRDIRLLPD